MEDLERNDGREKPYFMNKELMKLLNAHNVNTGKDRTDSQANIMEMEEVNQWTNNDLSPISFWDTYIFLPRNHVFYWLPNIIAILSCH